MKRNDPGWKLRNARRDAEASDSKDPGLSTKIINFCILVAVGGSAAYWIAWNLVKTASSTVEVALVLLGAILWIYGATIIHTVIHELGRLIFGAASGYRFCSFRIGSKIWYKKDGKTHTGRYSVAGTAGQCVMDPPDLVNGKTPHVLYLLGGAMMNLLAAAGFLCLWVLFRTYVIPAILLLETAAVGMCMGLMNAIPMRPSGANNEGRDLWDLHGSPEAVRAYWKQLKVTVGQTEGKRLRDLPEEWFLQPPENKWANPHMARLAACREQWLVDRGEYDEAAALADRLLGKRLGQESGLAELSRGFLRCDRLCCELLDSKDVASMARVRGTKQEEFNESMKDNPTVLRTEYLYALLWKKDKSAADAIRARFDEVAKTYPFSGELESQRELMDLALAKHSKGK